MSIQIGTWVVPALLTLGIIGLYIRWVITLPRPDGSYGDAILGMIVLSVAVIGGLISIIIWLVWALMS